MYSRHAYFERPSSPPQPTWTHTFSVQLAVWRKMAGFSRWSRCDDSSRECNGPTLQPSKKELSALLGKQVLDTSSFLRVHRNFCCHCTSKHISAQSEVEWKLSVKSLVNLKSLPTTAHPQGWKRFFHSSLLIYHLQRNPHRSSSQWLIHMVV